ncbi:MAG: hypothetical protein AAGA91_17095 [Pseudomonadota bacterium]
MDALEAGLIQAEIRPRHEAYLNSEHQVTKKAHKEPEPGCGSSAPAQELRLAGSRIA